MFKPHVTVACLVQAEGELLVVEETINGRPTGTSPPGILKRMKLCWKPQSANSMKRPASPRRCTISSR